MDLVHQLSEAALFQELCSGDMHAVPGLMTSSRLNCLMHLLTDEVAPPSSSSLLHFTEGQPSAGGHLLKTGMEASTGTVKASLDGVSCLDGRSANRNDATAAVESSQGGVPSAGEAALASSSDAHFDKPVLSLDREEGATEHSKPGADTFRRAVIYVGEDVTAQRSVSFVIPLFDVSYHYGGRFAAALAICAAHVCEDISCRKLPREITNTWLAKE